MAHAQKPDFIFRRNGRVQLKSAGASVQSTTGCRGVRISGSNAGYTMFRGSVKSTVYLLHLPFSPNFPSRASPCAITFQPESIQLRYFSLYDGLETPETLSDYCRSKRFFSNPKRVSAMGITRRPVPSVQCAISPG